VQATMSDSGCRIRALIVDDSRAMRSLLRKILGDVGVEVTAEAGNGQEALERLASAGPFQIALIDWNMPVMNGYELLCNVRSRAEWSDMRIMLVTTETEASQILRAFDAGADEYLLKPFAKEAVLEKLQLMGLLE
jgi:two-component system, chemotaxis family, chemotaxis protein CheY